MANDGPKLDLEMLDKLVNKLDIVYLKVLEVTEQLDKLASTKFTLGFSKEFRNAAADLNVLLVAVKGFGSSKVKIPDGLFDLFSVIGRISEIKIKVVNGRAYNRMAEVVTKIAALITTTKVSVSDTKRLVSVMDEFKKVIISIGTATSGRGIQLSKILAIKLIIKPMIDILKDLVTLASGGLTKGKADSLNDVIQSFGDIINTLAISLAGSSRLPSKNLIKQLVVTFTALRPVLEILQTVVLAAKNLTVTKLNALAPTFDAFGRLITSITTTFKDAGKLSVREIIKLSSFMKHFGPTLDAIALIVIALGKFDSKGVVGVSSTFDAIGKMLRGIADVMTSLKGIGFIGAALQNLIVILPLFGSIQEILRILLRFNPSELNAVGRIFFGLGQTFTAIEKIMRSIRDLKVGDLVASIGILVFVNRLFKQIKNFIGETTEFSASRLDGVGQIFRGIGQVFIGLGDSLRALAKNSESGFFKGIIKTIKDFTLLLFFLKPLFNTVRSILGSVVDVPPSTVQAIGEIFSSLGGITRALAQFSRDSVRITTLRELLVTTLAMRGVFGALGGVIKSILKASKGANDVPVGPIKDLLDTIVNVVQVFSRLSGDAKGFKKNELSLIEDTLKVLPRVFNQFKIKKGTETSLKSFVDLLQIVLGDIDTSGVDSFEKLIKVLSETDTIDVSTSGLGQLGKDLKAFFDSFSGVSADKIEATAKALTAVGKASKVATKSTETLTESNEDLGDSFEDALTNERVRVKIMGLLSTAFSDAAGKAKTFLQNVSAPGLITNGISKLRDLGDAIKDVGDELRDAGEEIREFGSELIENFGITGLFSSQGFQDTISFDKIGTQLQVFGNLNDEARTQAENFAFELGRQYPISAGEALDATLDLLKAGQSLDDIQFALPNIADLTALSDSGDLEAISGAMIQVVSVFDSFDESTDGTFENSATAADILSSAADASVSSVESLAEGLAKVGPLANVFGFTMEETTAALALFSNAGLSGAEAGTQLKSLLTNLQTSTAQDTMKRLGISVTDVNGNFLDLNSIVNNIGTALNEVSTVTFTPKSPLSAEAKVRYDAATKAAAGAARQIALYSDGLSTGSLDQEKANKKIEQYQQVLSNANGVIAEVTGSQVEADAITTEVTRTQADNALAIKELAGSYGSAGLAILLATGDDGLAGFIAEMNNVAPASERAQLLLDNLAGDLVQLGGSVSTAMTVALLPLVEEFFRPLIKILRFVVDGLLSMDRSVLEFIGTAVGLISVGATLVGGFLILLGTLLQVGGVIFILIGSLANLGFIIGVVVAATTAVVTGFVAIVAIFAVFVPLLVGATTIFKSLFRVFDQNIGGANDEAVSFFQELGAAIRDIISPIVSFFKAVRSAVSGNNQPLFLLEGVGRTIANVFRTLKEVLTSGFVAKIRESAETLSSFFRLVGSTLDSGGLTKLQNHLDIVRSSLFDFVNVFADVGFDTAFSGVTSQLDNSFGKIVGVLDDFYKNIFGFSRLGDDLKETFIDDGFVAGLTQGIEQLGSKLLASAIANKGALKDVFIRIMKFFFSPIGVVGFFANLFGIKPLQSFVAEFNKIFEQVIGGAFDFIFNLLEGQSFGDAFINAFGDGAEPLLDFLIVLGDAATNIASIVGLIFESFFGRFVDEGDDVSILNVITGIIEKLTLGLGLLNDLILAPLANGDVAGAFANIGTLIAEGFLGIVGSFTGLLDGVDILGIFTGIATSIVNLFATALSSAVSTLGDILGIDVSSILTTIEATLEANASILASTGTGETQFFGTISNTIVGLLVAAIQSAFTALTALTGITFDTAGLVASLDTLFEANLASANEGGILGAFSITANTIVGFLITALNTAFTAISGLTGIDTSSIQTAITDKFGEIITTLKTIFFGAEGETSIFDDLGTIANTVATAVSTILDALSGGGEDTETKVDALGSIVTFLGDIALLALDGITAPLTLIKEFVSFLAEQDAAELTRMGVALIGVSGGAAAFSAITGAGGLAAVAATLGGLALTPFAAITAGIAGISASFSAFAASTIGKFAGIASILVILKNLADNVDIFKESLNAFSDGDVGTGFTTLLDGLGETFTGVGLDVYELLGLDNLLGRSRTEVEATILQIEGLFTILGIKFSLFVETGIIAPLRQFLDVDVADVINEVRKIGELAGLLLSGQSTDQLLADEANLQNIFAADDLNLNSLAGYLNNDQTSEFLKEEIRILGRKNAPELAAQLAEGLNTASAGDLLLWGEIIDATGIFPDVAAAILNDGGDLTPIIDAIFASGGTVDPEDIQGLSTLIQKHISDNMTFDTFETDLGILQSIADSIAASGGDTTAIDDTIAYIKGLFEESLKASGDDPVVVEQEVEVVPVDGEGNLITAEDGIIPIPETSELPPVEIPTTFLPPTQTTEGVEGEEDTVIPIQSATLVPEEVTVDTSESTVVPPDEESTFTGFATEDLTDPETVAALNGELVLVGENFAAIEVAFAALQISGPLVVTSLTTIDTAFVQADVSSFAFYNTLTTQAAVAQASNSTAFGIINGNITAMGVASGVTQGRFSGFVGSAGQQAALLGNIVQGNVQKMISAFDALTRSVKTLTANLRDAIEQAQKASTAVNGINGVDGGEGTDGNRAIGGRTLSGGKYEITERGSSEVYEENGKKYLLASGAGTVLTMAQAFPDLSSARQGGVNSQAMQSNSGVTNISTSTTISEGDIIINITEPGATPAQIASEIQEVLAERDSRGATGEISVRDKLRTNHR